MSFIPIPCPPASGGGTTPEFDVEEVYYLCDVLNGEIVGTAVATFTYDESTGAPIGPPVYVDPITGIVYVPQGTLQPCPSGSTAEFILCDIQADGSSTQFIRKLIQSPTGLVLEVQDQTLIGAPYVPTGTVSSCDPYTTCTPDSNLDLGADCGPGEAADEVIVAADTTHPLANSVFVDDPLADPLCGGIWDNPAAALVAPFPVNETFRNTTFDQPGPVTQGTAPYPQLTAGAPINDGAGNGWLRMSDINSGTNGIWQVPTPFSSAQGMTSAITFAAHDGTIPGGDGLAFVFTDGSVAPQGIPIGGFGNLGLNNWQGGYIAVVLDEYGQTCTCDHTASPTVSPNPGPCGFCSNTISIQLAGAARATASCACCTLAQMPVAPKQINGTTRGQPGRLYVSIIAEAGQTYVSAGVDWNDGNGIVQYFDRVNVTACAGPAPATLRMATYGGSGGAYRDVKEYRDATARPAGSSHWRAFPITTDPILPCVTLVTLTGSVDVTFNSDTQVAGNGDPEAYFWLVNEATNTVVARAQKSSIPTQTGTPTTLTWTFAVPPTDIPNLRMYVGSESRDQNGEYDTLWENLTIDATGAGCPAVQRRTMEISARCPIPVTIVGGGTDGGGGGGTTVVNTPATFEDALVCVTIAGLAQQGFRRETRAADGTIDVQFWGLNGTPITPDSWVAGPCEKRGVETQKVCDLGSATSLIARYSFDDAGVLIDTQYYTLDGTGPVAPIGPLSEGGCCDPFDLGESCYDSGGGIIRRARGERRCDPSAPPAFTLFFYDTETGVLLPAPTFVDCPPDETLDFEERLLCDSGPTRFIRTFVYSSASPGIVQSFFDTDLNGAPFAPIGGVIDCDQVTVTEMDIEQEVLCDNVGPFIREYRYNNIDGAFISFTNLTLAGAGYVPVGPIVICPQTTVLTPEFDVEIVTLCDDNGGFFRRFTYDESTGLPTTVITTDFAGAPYVPVGTVRVCDISSTVTLVDAEIQFMCDSNGPTTFLRRYIFNETTGAIGAVLDFTLAGAPYAPVGTVTAGACTPAAGAGVDTEEEILCDNNGGFIRRKAFNNSTGVLISTTDLTFAGAAYVPVGTVRVCFDPSFEIQEEVLCDNNGGFIRRYVFNGTTGAIISTTDLTLAGAPYVTVGTVRTCSLSDDVELIEHCDLHADGTTTTFYKRLTFDGNGVLLTTVFIDGSGAIYVPTGTVTVGQCSSCCPIQVGSGCTNVGSLTYVSIRQTNGTVITIDPVTGLTVLPANIVPCVQNVASTTRTLNSQMVIAVPGTPWTPALVTGVLTSVTATVLSGTMTVTDSDATVSAGLPTGYTATWNAQDANILTGPQSIASVGGTIAVIWTQR